MKTSIKFEVFSSSSFEGVFDCMPKILGLRDLGHAPFEEIHCTFLVMFAKF